MKSTHEENNVVLELQVIMDLLPKMIFLFFFGDENHPHPLLNCCSKKDWLTFIFLIQILSLENMLIVFIYKTN